MKKNNIKIFKLLMDYAQENNIILEINEKSKYGYTPIFGTTDNDNLEMLKLLLNYSEEKDIKLIINEDVIKKIMAKNIYYVHLKNISEINTIYMYLIYLYKNKNIIKIIYSKNSYFSKIFNEFKKSKIDQKLKEFNDAVYTNNIQKLKIILNNTNENENILIINEKCFGVYPFIVTILMNNIEMVKLLIDYANNNKIIFKINEKGQYGRYPFLEHTINNNIEMLRLLIDYSIKNNITLQINKIDKFGDYPLLEAIYSDNIEIMVREKKKVLEGIKLGSKKSINDTSLTFECKKNNIERVELLINNGKNINKKNKDGDTPLIIACKNNNMELVKCLLNHKEIDINLKSDYDINSIMVASYFNNKDIVDYLIENNANIEMQDRKNNLPLHIACYLNSDIEIIKSLGNNNNNLSTIKNLYGYTPLEITKELKNKAATDLLTGKEIESDDSDSDNEENFSKLTDENIISYEKKPISFNKFFDKINQSICKIKTDKDVGTGFFIEIPVPSKEKSMYGIMTDNHVLNESVFKTNKTFKIYMANNEEQVIEIPINKKDFIFTSELIDITFMELDINIIENIEPVFLHPSDKDAIIHESIIIYQYARSSGSALLNKNYEVVGIHKSKITEEYEDGNIVFKNIAIKYSEVEFAIRMSFNNINKYGMERAKKSVKLLLENEMETLNRYGLQLKLTSNDIIRLEKSINEKTNIKKLDWSPLIPNSIELNEKINSKIEKGNGREYTLITWLKLTELIYL
ncbi:ankyrin [Neocallimastix lanati (nom. inval.)]|uniref:Ankyrin n=1 Tax=Neocallimastix californiae TaxID=1754190 RepID=A0A1Y2DEF9_9FUNG|nr:ankyrin [Neocallimastix sp. JGI-2020a]ORY57658.1 ankyrin [Neocallimastix californiae]|eukprot:ORY57658.1 ankyrin [Neocallimastix californiae]